MKRSLISGEQIGAIITAAKLGDRLQQDHPELADLFRDGTSYYRIITRLSLQQTYGVTYAVAYRALYFALHGYTPSASQASLSSFPGLLSDEKAETLAREHYRLAGSISGRRQVRSRTGLYALDQESLTAARKRGAETQQREQLGIFGLSTEELRTHGAQGAARAKALGVGVVHGSTADQRRQHAQLGGLAAVCARGQQPWTEEEKNYAHALSRDPVYCHQTPLHKGKPHLEQIAAEVNKQFHDGASVRTRHAIATNLRLSRKK